MRGDVVALDGREFRPGRQTGIGRYLWTLVDHVRTSPPGWRLEIVGPPGLATPDGTPARTVGAADGLAWDLLRLPRYLRQARARAYLTPYVKFRPTARCPVVAVVCDPSDLVPEPGRGVSLRHAAIRRLRRRLLARAAARVTISAWSRDELARILGLPAASFQVIPPGVERPAGRPAADEAGYVLHLSNGKPHKNVERLLDAYAGLPEPLQSAHPLVVAGLHADRRPGLERALARHAPKGRVHLDGHVAEAALAGLYANAAVFAFPSLAEGFGIPPLEAMAAGVPVVASTAGALPETLGDAAVLVDPRRSTELRDALAACLTDRTLRATLTERGRARAARFPRERTGAALAAVVDEVRAGGAPR